MFTLFLVFILTFIFFHWLTTKPRNYPPGPLNLPIVGSALSVEIENFHLYLEKIKKYYGPVIGFKFGPNYTIGVAGPKEVKEVLTREEFQGRPYLPFSKPGIMFNEGQSWSVQRKFTVRHLREFGFGKKSVENVIFEEAEDFFENVLRKQDVVQVSGLFTVSTINVLWAMMGGKRCSHEDADFKHLLDCLQKRFRAGDVTGGLSNTFPILRKLFPRLKYFQKEIEIERLVDEFLQKAVDEHKETKTEQARDFIDVYLTELEKSELHPSFSEERLKNVCSDLFAAGSESVSNSLGFCLLYFVLYPEWQEELYKEIQMNSDVTSYLENQNKFPKVQAFLSEVSRCNTIASLTVPHKALEDTELSGFFIPKNTIILLSIWSILQDKDYWKDPENFRPERFLDEDGKYQKNLEGLPIFGIGKRICPGESLARSIIFVFFIALVKECKFSLPEGDPRPSTVCLSGFTNAPRPFEVKITKRL